MLLKMIEFTCVLWLLDNPIWHLVKHVNEALEILKAANYDLIILETSWNRAESTPKLWNTQMHLYM